VKHTKPYVRSCVDRVAIRAIGTVVQTVPMRIVVIGGTGHVGSFLVPRLVRSGHQVVVLSRGARQPYVEDPAWAEVEQIAVDRDAADADGSFPGLVRDLQADVVIDMVCFTLESARQLVDGLRGHVDHLIHCGSIWRHGPSLKVPVTEETESEPFGDYGIQKAAIATLLKEETAQGGLTTTSLHPGHISGPGWQVVNPIGNVDPAVWQALAGGTEIAIPGNGAETLAHVHADDVAQAFALAVEHRDTAAGEDINITAASALTVRGFARIAAGWFGQEAQLRPVSWDDFRATTATESADASWDHLYRSPCMSIEKARRLLGYAPAYEPEDAAYQAVRWLVDHGELDLANPFVR
jgi:nucleoside-diphosphate-sugar epimerase